MKITYKIYLFVQDQCSVSKQMKKEYDLDILSKATIQDINIEKLYPTRTLIDKFDLKHVPTLVIVSSDELHPRIELERYKTNYFISKTNLVYVLEKLKNEEKLHSNIQY